MKRKTNLFYKTDIENNFIMLSNYTESMTGNYLSMDVKLFPSKFLCLYMPSILNNPVKKNEFIQYLASRYENKLAFLRDKVKEENSDQEKRIKPIGWLMDCIHDFDPEIEISFVGQVTEQDYNGIYSDTICMIDSSATRRGNLFIDSEDYTDYEEYDCSYSYLYGWYDVVGEEEHYSGPSEYQNVRPVFDIEHKYIYKPQCSYIGIDESEEQSSIEFNVVIPLYDVINVDHNENNDIIESLEKIDLQDDATSVVNVPYGIWMNDELIKLTRDENGYGVSWSLCLSSQFKPFPYSFNKPSEVDADARGEAFNTFASILTRQNSIISQIEKFSYILSDLSTQISLIESQVSNIATVYNIDNIKNELASVKSDVSYLMSRI